MGLTRQSVQRTADLLEEDGLLAYADDPAHRRAKLALLTSRGRATLDAITTRQIEWANRITSRLPETDLQRALYTLRQVRDALEMPHHDRETRALVRNRTSNLFSNEAKEPRDRRSDETLRLLKAWGRLHAVRGALGVAASMLFLWAATG
jgi:hypothetical protein